ncbi:MAG: M48 family metalloprotease, partial [Pseudomonadota bacterium]
MLDYARPLMRAAGVNQNRIDIVLVNDRSFNAFVSGRKIFINVGAIVQSEVPNELIGVIAHEIAHLAGGHQDRLRQQIDRAQTIAIVTAAIGVGAAVAAASSGAGEVAGAGAGLAAGGSELARRGLLAYQRTEELAADRAAIDYLNATGQSSKGILTTFQRFQ